MSTLRSFANLRTVCAFALASTALSPIAAFSQDTDDQGSVVLDEIVIEGDKAGRTVDEIAPSIVVIPQDRLEQPGKPTVFSTINSVPNVVAEEDGTIPTIRGISSTVNTNQVFGSGVVPRVPILVDNVATSAAQSSGLLSNSAWDVSVVEVAKGPQTTSTGRNAFSGAIRVFTNDPVFKPEYALRLGASHFRGEKNAAFIANQPFLDDQVAIRVAGQIRDGRTTVKTIDPRANLFDTNELNYKDLRAKIRLVPNAMKDLDIQFTYDINTSRDAYAPVVEPPQFNFLTGALIVPGNRADQRFLRNYAGVGSYDVTKRQKYIGEASYKLSDTNKLFLRASRASTDLRNPSATAALPGLRPFGTVLFDTLEHEFEAYLQFAVGDVIRRGVVGAITTGSNEIVDTDSSGLVNPFLIDVDGKARTTGLYGEVEINIGKPAKLDGLTLIAGGRLEFDKRSRSVSADTQLQSNASFNQTIFLPKAGLKYEFSKGTEIGYTYSKAYRPGGVEVDLVSGFVFPIGVPGVLGVSPFGRELINNHEIYAKGSFFGDRLKLSATGFYYVYKDAQVSGASNVASAFPGFFLTGNVPKVVGKGVELSAEYKHDSGLSANASLGFLKTKITESGPIAARFQGNRLPNAPEFTASLGLKYENERGWFVGANVSHKGEMESTLGGVTLQAQTLVDVYAGYNFKGPKGLDMKFDVGVNNLFNKAYFVEQPSPQQLITNRPRTFTASLTARF